MNGDSNVCHFTMGFDEPELGSQQTFRAMVKALDNPGDLVQIQSKLSVPKALDPASAALFLILCNDRTTVWADLDWNWPLIHWFHLQCGCDIVTEPCMASLALITKPNTMPPLDRFRIGDNEDPDTSVTLIVQVDRLSANTAKNQICWIINRMRTPSLKGVPAHLWDLWSQQSYGVPWSVDIFLTCDNTLTVIPQLSG